MSLLFTLTWIRDVTIFCKLFNASPISSCGYAPKHSLFARHYLVAYILLNCCWPAYLYSPFYIPYANRCAKRTPTPVRIKLCPNYREKECTKMFCGYAAFSTQFRKVREVESDLAMNKKQFVKLKNSQRNVIHRVRKLKKGEFATSRDT